MKKLWIGILLLSLVWLFALPVYEPRSGFWWLVLLLGLAVNTAALWKSRPDPLPLSYGLFIGPFALLAFVTPWPRSVGALLVILALIIGISFRNGQRIRTSALGLGFSGLVLVIQSMVWPIYQHVASRLHSLSALDPIFVSIVTLLGGKAASGHEGILIQTAKGVSEVYTTAEALGSYVLINVALGAIVLISLSERPWDKLLKVMLVLTGYSFARYVSLVLALASFETADILWLRLWQVVSFLPLPFLMMKVLPPVPERLVVAMPPVTPNWRGIAATSLLVLSAFAMTGAFLFQDPGERKQGRVLFDEGHSDWEWMTRPYDTEWYGEQSGYNYNSMGEFLKHYYLVDIKREPLTPQLLNNYDVIVLKTPTSPYSGEEVAAVEDFVRSGGGLWMIGDHTNVFGMTTYLNQIATRLGFAFKFDATYDLATGDLSFYRPDRWLRHPVLNQVPFYMFATSCSLDAPMLSEDVIVGYGLKGVRGDYSQRNFFPKGAQEATALEYGLLLQNAAGKFGKGRVLLYTDSTCFSNFYMFMTGKPELALGSIEWLNRKNRFWLVSPALITLSLLSLGLVFLTRNARRREDPPVPVRVRYALKGFVAVVLGFSSAVLIFGKINAANYPPSAPHTGYPTVAFEADHSRYYLPVAEFRSIPQSDLQTFYVWTQRLGLVPVVRYSFAGCLTNSDALVLVNPTRTFSQKEVDQFIRYVEAGGKALILDDPRNMADSTAYQLLRPFDMRIDYAEIPQGEIVDEKGSVICEAQHLAGVKGGSPFLFARPPSQQQVQRQEPPANPATGRVSEGQSGKPDAEGGDAQALTAPDRRPLLSVSKRGNGILCVMGNSTIFAAQTMGSTSAVPDAKLRKVYDLEFQIFRDLLQAPQEVDSKFVSRR